MADGKQGLRTFRGKVMSCHVSSFDEISWWRTENGYHLEQMDFGAVSVFGKIERIKECPVLN